MVTGDITCSYCGRYYCGAFMDGSPWLCNANNIKKPIEKIIIDKPLQKPVLNEYKIKQILNRSKHTSSLSPGEILEISTEISEQYYE